MRQLLLKLINKSWPGWRYTIPEDWSWGMITPGFKNGYKLDPAYYRAMTLLSIPESVL